MLQVATANNITDIQRGSQTSCIAPYNRVVSHGAPIGGIQVFADHTCKNKRMYPRSLCTVQRFTHVHLHAQITATVAYYISCWFCQRPWNCLFQMNGKHTTTWKILAHFNAADHMWCITAKGTLMPLLQVTGLVKYYSVIRAQQSFQVKRLGCKLWPPLTMLCTDKGSMVQAQYCSEWTEFLWHASSFDSFVPKWPNQNSASLLSSLSIYHWLASNVCKSDTSGSWLKVPFAVTRHILPPRCQSKSLKSPLRITSIKTQCFACILYSTSPLICGLR